MRWNCSRAARRGRPGILSLERLEDRTTPSFVAASTYEVASPPQALAVGDVNGDGLLDVVTVGTRGLLTAAVLLGRADGTFQPARSTDFAGSGNAIALADFDGDGALDLAVPSGNAVGVLRGNGDGTFQPRVPYATGPEPLAVVAGDFNGDGAPDLATANFTGVSVSVLLNDGFGGFAPPRNLPLSFSAWTLAAVDVNYDGALDLAAVHLSSYQVSVLVGAGDGSFAAPRAYSTATEPRNLAVADLNGDGYEDVVTVNGVRNQSCTASVLLANPDGSLQAAVHYLVGGTLLESLGLFAGVALADFDGDGPPDLAVGCGGAVHLLRGFGDGALDQPVRVAAGNPWALAAGDFDGDSLPDLVVADGRNRSERGAVTALLNSGDGRFQADHLLDAADTPVGSVKTADFNGDGTPDLVGVGNGHVVVRLGNGDGTFGVPVRTMSVAGAASAVADMNGDGLDDLVISYQVSFKPQALMVRVLLSRGDGTFLLMPTTPRFIGWAGGVRVGDFNGDGLLDVRDINGNLLFGNGDGTLQPPIRIGVAGRTVADAADLDGDGRLDLIVGAGAIGSSTILRIFLGNGNGTFREHAAYDLGQQIGLSGALADFNGDGIPDVAVITASSLNWRLHVLLGNGDGTFQTPSSFSLGWERLSLAAADFNGDGLSDLAVASPGIVEVLLSNGDDRFRFAASYASVARSTSLAALDVNGDKLPDLVTADPDARAFRLFVNDGIWGGLAPGSSPGGDWQAGLALTTLRRHGERPASAGW